MEPKKTKSGGGAAAGGAISNNSKERLKTANTAPATGPSGAPTAQHRNGNNEGFVNNNNSGSNNGKGTAAAP